MEKVPPLVAIVGVGALGSHVVQFIRNVNAHLLAIDFDRVEQKNARSQFYGSSQVGRGKAAALSEVMNYLWKRKVGTMPHRLTKDSVDAMLSSANLVLDCLDNGESRRVLQRYVREKKVPCLHGALAADGTFGRVVWDKDFVVDDESSAGAATCEDGDHLPFIGLVAAHMAESVKGFIMDGRMIGFSVTPRGTIVL